MSLCGLNWFSTPGVAHPCSTSLIGTGWVFKAPEAKKKNRDSKIFGNGSVIVSSNSKGLSNDSVVVSSNSIVVNNSLSSWDFRMQGLSNNSKIVNKDSSHLSNNSKGLNNRLKFVNNDSIRLTNNSKMVNNDSRGRNDGLNKQIAALRSQWRFSSTERHCEAEVRSRSNLTLMNRLPFDYCVLKAGFTTFAMTG